MKGIVEGMRNGKHLFLHIGTESERLVKVYEGQGKKNLSEYFAIPMKDYINDKGYRIITDYLNEGIISNTYFS